MRPRAVFLVTIAAVALFAPPSHSRQRAVSHRTVVRVRSLEPASGPIAGGTLVTISGGGFIGGTVVTIDGVASPYELVNGSTIRLITPPRPNGFAPIVISNRHGRAGAEFLFVPPSLDSLERGEITTVAGIGQYVGEGAEARDIPFEPSDIAMNAAGTLFVAEAGRHLVREISASGSCSRAAGNGLASPPGAIDEIGDGGSALEAFVLYPQGVEVGPAQSLYIADQFSHRIRRVDRQTGRIETVAGSGPVTYAGAFAGDGGPATSARLDQPNQVAFDGRGNLYILDGFNYRIRRVDPNGVITTIAGNGQRGFSGDGGPAIAASFDFGPNGDAGSLASDFDGNIYVADVDNRRIRHVDVQTGTIVTIAGGGSQLQENIPATDASLRVRGLAVARDGTIYCGDATRIRKIDRDGRISTIFGMLTAGFSPDGTNANNGRLSSVDRMMLDEARNTLFFCEFGTSRVRSLNLTTTELATVAGIGPSAFGENGLAIAALLDTESSQLAVDDQNRLIMSGRTRMRRLGNDGVLTTLAGGGIVPDDQPPPVRAAIGIPVDTFGVASRGEDLFVTTPTEVARISADGRYHRIAGSDYGYEGDGGDAASAKLDNPSGIAIDADGNLIIADSWNHCIRKIHVQTGIIERIAGRVPPHAPNTLIHNPSSGDGGAAIDAQLSQPTFVAVDAGGTINVSDAERVRSIDRNGTIDTVLQKEMFNCSAGPLASDVSGRVYVRCFNGSILRIDGPNRATEISSVSSHFGFSGDGGPARDAMMRGVFGMAIDRDGNVYLNDTDNRRIRVIKEVAR